MGQEKSYVLAVDQSTQGTKGILFDRTGKPVSRMDLPHRQIVNDRGWVSHDLNEIWENTIKVMTGVIAKAGIHRREVACIGISNQRETSCAFSRETGEPLGEAIVWQCARAEEICRRIRGNAVTASEGADERIRVKTGIPLSPYFPASKFAWLQENLDAVKKAKKDGTLAFGTVDTYLLYRMTGGKTFATEYANASRTQLFNIHDLAWDPEICSWFGIDMECLPEVVDSSHVFGETTLEGYFDEPVPITGVIGDSQGALFAQGCIGPGMVKATYGTGSSVMMNIGETLRESERGLVTSIGWGRDGRVTYVLEGNINYSGAVITWLKNDVGLIASPGESQDFALAANPADTTYLVPAFTGLGAPYWKPDVRAMLYGMSRTTGRNELVKAGLESIGYQIADIVNAMGEDVAQPVRLLCVDGGPTANQYLMQFQSDILNTTVRLPACEESSAQGAAFLAGLCAGVYRIDELFTDRSRSRYEPRMSEEERSTKYRGWQQAVKTLCSPVQGKIRLHANAISERTNRLKRST